MWMNEYDIEDAVRRWDDGEHPVLLAASQTLDGLKDWVNGNSDGWAHWRKPGDAAAKLMELVDRARRGYARPDLPVTEYVKACTTIKAFRTRMEKAGMRPTFVIEPPLCGERFAGLRCAQKLGHKGGHSIVKAAAS